MPNISKEERFSSVGSMSNSLAAKFRMAFVFWEKLRRICSMYKICSANSSCVVWESAVMVMDSSWQFHSTLSIYQPIGSSENVPTGVSRCFGRGLSSAWADADFCVGSRMSRQSIVFAVRDSCFFICGIFLL